MDCAEEYKSALYKGALFNMRCAVGCCLNCVHMCKCANFALQSVFAMDLQCAIKVQQQRAQLKILFEGSFATFPPPTSALVEKIQQPGT